MKPTLFRFRARPKRTTLFRLTGIEIGPLNSPWIGAIPEKPNETFMGWDSEGIQLHATSLKKRPGGLTCIDAYCVCQGRHCSI
jgi:hypothetical protein